VRSYQRGCLLKENGLRSLGNVIFLPIESLKNGPSGPLKTEASLKKPFVGGRSTMGRKGGKD